MTNSNSIIQTEQAVLGAMLMNPGYALPAAIEMLSASDFAVRQHGQAFDVLRAMSNSSTPIDIVSVYAALETAGVGYDTATGRCDVHPTEWASACPNPGHIRQYCRQVAAGSQRRQTLDLCDRLTKKIHEGEATSQEDFRALLEDHMTRMMALQNLTMHSKKGIRTGHEVVEQVVDTALARYGHRGQPLGLTLGFADLDRAINGFQYGDFVILAARPAMGKTALGTAFAEAVALDSANRRNVPTLMFSLEMSDEQIMERSLLGRARIALGKGRTGMFSDAEGSVWYAAKKVLPTLRGKPVREIISAIVDAASTSLEAYWTKKGKLSDGSIDREGFQKATRSITSLAENIAACASGSLSFYDGYGVTTQEVRSQIRKWVRSIGWVADGKDQCPPLVIIDYLQLVKASEKAAARDPRLTIMEVCAVMKGTAKELGICIMGLAQMGRGTADNPGQKPQLKDLKESGSMEEYADYVLSLHRESYYKRWEALQEAAQQNWEASAEGRNKMNVAAELGEPRWTGQTYYEATAMVTILKGRHCPTGDHWITFHGPLVRFASRTPSLYSTSAERREQPAPVPVEDKDLF